MFCVLILRILNTYIRWVHIKERFKNLISFCSLYTQKYGVSFVFNSPQSLSLGLSSFNIFFFAQNAFVIFDQFDNGK